MQKYTCKFLSALGLRGGGKFGTLYKALVFVFILKIR